MMTALLGYLDHVAFYHLSLYLEHYIYLLAVLKLNVRLILTA